MDEIIGLLSENRVRFLASISRMAGKLQETCEFFKYVFAHSKEFCNES